MEVRQDQKGGEGPKIAFHLPREMLDAVTVVAANEAISRSDVARRALIKDLASRKSQ
jgi:hypothetical protein